MRATDRYEAQRAGLGVTFVTKTRGALGRIAAHLQPHAPAYLDIRKAVLPKVPYVILDREEPGEVIVVSVFHTSRGPLHLEVEGLTHRCSGPGPPPGGREFRRSPLTA